MPVSSEEYRSAARHFASGVTVVTVSWSEELHGMTASSFATISLDPPLVLVSLGESSRTRLMIHEAGIFAVNILSEEQEHIAHAFGSPGDKTFDGCAYHLGEANVPLLDASLVSMTCLTTEVVTAGDHELFIAEVLATEENEGRPLLYFDRAYRSLP